MAENPFCAKELHTPAEIQLAKVKRCLAQILRGATEDSLEAGGLAETYRDRLSA